MTNDEAAGRQFPAGFVWGAATAGHQIEGNNVNSDYWFMENIEPTLFVERSGDACNSYHRYPDDIALLAKLGLNAYRFSVEWSRVEPTPGHFSIAELEHYRRVIDCCHQHGLAAAVSFNHNACPRWFAAAGGWTNPDSPTLFARYCATVTRALGDGLAFGFTLNEPQLGDVFRSIPGAGAHFGRQDPTSIAMHEAAAMALGTERFVTMEHPDLAAMTPQLLAAHEQGYAAIKAERSDLPVGVTLSMTDFQPGGDGSPYEAVRERAYGVWLDCITRAGDFTGVQTYRQIRLPGSGPAYEPLPLQPFTEPGDRIADMQRPEALRNTVEYAHARTGKPVVVTENGLETDDDERRAWYVGQVLAGLHEAISRGVPVLGYFHWTLIDNFEWTRGYGPKMGLVEVDHTTFARTPKPSATRLGDIARSNALSDVGPG